MNALQRRHLFVHVPKTGGTTMGQILLRNFGASFYSYYGLWDLRQLEKSDVVSILDLHPQYRCIASHMFSLDLPFESPKWNISAFAFVRHPVERALSLYFHIVQMNQKNGQLKYAQQIEPFFDKVFDEKIDLGFFDYQTRFLFPYDDPSLVSGKIDCLIRSKKILLAPLERFTEACLLLEKRFPNDFRDTAFSKIYMKSPRNQEIPIGLQKRILENNQSDLELYNSCLSQFDEQLAEEFEERYNLEKAKADHALRSQKLRQREKMEQLRNSITRSFGNLLGRFIK
jgi:hypothetical protein